MRSFETIIWDSKHKAYFSENLYVFPIYGLCFQYQMIVSKFRFLFPIAFLTDSNVKLLFPIDVSKLVSG